MIPPPLLFLLFLLLCNTVYSFDNHIRFRHFSDIEGFPSKYVEMGVQDKNGFLWFATYDGLVRFDGYNYKTFKPRESDSSSLEVKMLLSLDVDENNDIWIGSSQGISVYYQKSDKFKNYNFLSKDYLFKNKSVSSVKVSENYVWIGTEEGLILFNHVTNTSKLLEENIIVSRLLVHDGLVYACTDKKGILVYSELTHKLIHEINSDLYPALDELNNSVQEIKADDSGNLWFVTSNAGLFRYTPLENTVKKIVLDVASLKDDAMFVSVEVVNDSTYFIGTLNHGLVYSYNGEQQQLKMRKSDQYGISSNSIRYIFRDSQGSVWFSCHIGSVFMLDMNEMSVKYFYQQEGKPNSLPHNIVSSFAQDKYGNVWVGTDGGGVAVYNQNWELIKEINSQNDLTSDAVTEIQYDGGKYMYFAEWGGGVDRCNVETFAMESFFNKPDSIYSRFDAYNDLKGILIDSKKRLWILPHLSGLWIYDGKNNQFYSKKNAGGYAAELFNKLKLTGAAEDKNGNIWLYGYEGLIRYTADNRFVEYKRDVNDKHSLLSKNIKYLFVDSKGNVWVCTDNGICLYQTETDDFLQISNKYSLPQKILSLEEDINGKLWFSSEKGFGYFDPSDYASVIFNKNVAIKGDDFYEKASTVLADGNILFGSTNGFIAFHPSEISINMYQPPIALTDFQVFNESIGIGDSSSLLDKAIVYSDSLILTHSHSVVSFEVSALNFISPNKNQYRYKLEGFDKEWHDIGTDRKITYTNLDAKTYNLQIQASNNDGVWNEDGHSIVITVLPPWWETMWFRLAVVLFAAILIVGIYFIRTRNIRIANQKLKELVAEKTKQLTLTNQDLVEMNEEVVAQKEALEKSHDEIVEQKEQILQQNEDLEKLNKTKDRLFSIIGHDLKNPLSIIIGFCGLLDRSMETYPVDKTKKILDYINSSAISINELLNNLLTWSRSEKNLIESVPQAVDVREIISTNINLYEVSAKAKEIDITVAIKDGLQGYCDYNMFDTVVRNLINNALKFTREKGVVAIDAFELGDACVISVTDNGIGIPADKLKELRETDISFTTIGTSDEKGTGLGIKLCKVFVSKNKGHIHIDSDLDVGTRFTVLFHKTRSSFMDEKDLQSAVEMLPSPDYSLVHS